MNMDKKWDTGTNGTGYYDSLLYAYQHIFSFATEVSPIGPLGFHKTAVLYRLYTMKDVCLLGSMPEMASLN